MFGRPARLFLAGCLALPVAALSQAPSRVPWTVVLTSQTSPLELGQCSRIDLAVNDPATRERARTPDRDFVRSTDFDFTASTPGGTAVVTYSGESVFACACPAGTPGTSLTATATYPRRGIASSRHVRGVAFQKSVDIPLVPSKGSYNPPECAELAASPSVAGISEIPWTVILTPQTSPLRLGQCSRIDLTINDPATRDRARAPDGNFVKSTDFDFTASAPGGTAVVTYSGESVFACACPAGTPGTSLTATATYPRQGIAAGRQVADVAFQKSVNIPLVPSRGNYNPPECADPAASLRQPAAPVSTLAHRSVQPRNITTKTLNLSGNATGNSTAQVLNPTGAVAVRNITTQTLTLSGPGAVGTITARISNPVRTSAVRNITTQTLILTGQK